MSTATDSELEQKIIIPGGAGLVGQNLVAILKRQGYRRLVVIDKHAANLEVLARLHPDVVTEHADLAEPGTGSAISLVPTPW